MFPTLLLTFFFFFFFLYFSNQDPPHLQPHRAFHSNRLTGLGRFCDRYHNATFKVLSMLKLPYTISAQTMNVMNSFVHNNHSFIQFIHLLQHAYIFLTFYFLFFTLSVFFLLALQ